MKTSHSFGYLLGLLIFVIGIPALMWLVSGRPWPYVPNSTLLCVVSVLFVICGLVLSIYSIVYMRIVGKGNPFDAYGHEVAPRTRHLMTEGPYSLCRNPMLVGIYIYDVGILVWLWSVLPLMNETMTIDKTNMCSHLQKKLFDEDGAYHHLWLAMQDDPELTAVVRSRQLHIYRNGKKVLVLAGKAVPKIIREDKLCEMAL